MVMNLIFEIKYYFWWYELFIEGKGNVCIFFEKDVSL